MLSIINNNVLALLLLLCFNSSNLIAEIVKTCSLYLLNSISLKSVLECHLLLYSSEILWILSVIIVMNTIMQNFSSHWRRSGRNGYSWIWWWSTDVLLWKCYRRSDHSGIFTVQRRVFCQITSKITASMLVCFSSAALGWLYVGNHPKIHHKRTLSDVMLSLFSVCT